MEREEEEEEGREWERGGVAMMRASSL